MLLDSLPLTGDSREPFLPWWPPIGPQAGRLLGTSIVWKGLASVLTYGVLIGLSQLLGYPSEVRLVISLVFIGYFVDSISNAGQWVILGFERADVAAYRQVIAQSATLLIVLPILLFGGGVSRDVGRSRDCDASRICLHLPCPPHHLVQAAVFRREHAEGLAPRGTPFVFISLAMVLQPTIDAAFLSKLAPADVVGWHSAARRLIGFLAFPVGALIGALYPTLCRLHATNQESFRQTVKSALRATSLLVCPVALGCLLYPDIGIAFFDRTSFRPAEDNLRVLSVMLFLLYFTMPLGICITGRGSAAGLVDCPVFLCSRQLVLDPLLIPWFQQRTGNGGLGLCAAAGMSARSSFSSVASRWHLEGCSTAGFCGRCVPLSCLVPRWWPLPSR